MSEYYLLLIEAYQASERVDMFDANDSLPPTEFRGSVKRLRELQAESDVANKNLAEFIRSRPELFV